jgi:hypothetical protein
LNKKLTILWKNNGYTNFTIKCENTSLLTENYTKRNFKEWGGYLTPLSPGAPGRNAIKYQYFSSESKESWTLNYKNPESIYYLVGMGKSYVTIDGTSICKLKVNPLGLGDIFITDFTACIRVSQ